jgi:pantoate--beta-alanine ligase
MPIAELERDSVDAMTFDEFKPEYFSIVDGNTLQPVVDIAKHSYVVACTAVWAGDVRLIDNVILRQR